jgi:hypothetical protein
LVVYLFGKSIFKTIIPPSEKAFEQFLVKRISIQIKKFIFILEYLYNLDFSNNYSN